MKVVAGDIGGTHSRLLLAETKDEELSIQCEKHYRNDEFDGLTAVIAAFGIEAGIEKPLDRACLAIAGPVDPPTGAQEGRLTNRPWSFTASQVSDVLNRTPAVFINDFEAVGWGLPLLQPDDIATLQQGEPDAGAPRAALGAGSGLGTVVALPTDCGWRVIASEGGHADMAPGAPEELPLLDALWRHYGHASWERVVSGPGLQFIYQVQCGLSAETSPPLSPPEISRAAFAEGDADAVSALRIFCRLYGAQAGNLALTVLPRGGLFIAGGIAPHVLKPPFAEEFMARFLAKGRMRRVLERIPVYRITSARTGLLGAAHYARAAANR